MRKTILALATMAGILAPSTVANAAPTAVIRCATTVNAVGGQIYNLSVATNYPRYTGRPFSFRVYYNTRTRSRVIINTYIPVGRSIRVTIPGAVNKVESWQSGTKCRTYYTPSVL